MELTLVFQVELEPINVKAFTKFRDIVTERKGH